MICVFLLLFLSFLGHEDRNEAHRALTIRLLGTRRLGFSRHSGVVGNRTVTRRLKAAGGLYRHVRLYAELPQQNDVSGHLTTANSLSPSITRGIFLCSSCECRSVLGIRLAWFDHGARRSSGSPNPFRAKYRRVITRGGPLFPRPSPRCAEATHRVASSLLPCRPSSQTMRSPAPPPSRTPLVFLPARSLIGNPTFR